MTKERFFQRKVLREENNYIERDNFNKQMIQINEEKVF